MRNIQREYATVFDASEEGEYIEPDKLFESVFEKQSIHILLQVITNGVNEEDYHIDF